MPVAMKPAIPDILSVWPLRHTVVFPDAVHIVRDTRPACHAAITEASLTEHRLCLFAAQRDAADDEPAAEAFHCVGTIAMIMRIGSLAAGGSRAMVQGLCRVRIQQLRVEASGYHARWEVLEERTSSGATEIADLVRVVRDKVEKLWALMPSRDPELPGRVRQTDAPGPLAHLIAAELPLDVPECQAILELDDAAERLRRVSDRLDEALNPSARLDTVARLEQLERVYEAQFPGHDPQKIKAFVTAAAMYRNMTMPAQAIPLYEKILAIRQATESQPSRARVETLNDLSIVLAVVGRHLDATAPAEEMVAILKKHYPGEQAALYSGLNTLAGCARMLGRHAEAERSWLEILALVESGFAARKESVAATYNNLGSLYVTMKDYLRGEQALSRALSLKRELYGEEHPDVGLTLYNLAYLYECLGQTEKASATRSQAVQMMGRNPTGN
jgi:Lon protease-like protein